MLRSFRRRTVLFSLAALLSWILASPAAAYEPDVRPVPPPSGGCLGSNDPYCEGGGGGDGPGFGFGCEVCELLLEDNTDPGSAYYGCVEIDVFEQNGYSDCVDGDDAHYCSFSNFCTIV